MKPDCPALKHNLADIVVLKESFDTVLTAASRTGNTHQAQELRRRFETKVANLRRINLVVTYPLPAACWLRTGIATLGRRSWVGMVRTFGMTSMVSGPR